MGRRVDNLHFGSLLFFFSLKSLSFLMMNLVSGITGLGHHLFPLVTPTTKDTDQAQAGVEALYCRMGRRGL